MIKLIFKKIFIKSIIQIFIAEIPFKKALEINSTIKLCLYMSFFLPFRSPEDPKACPLILFSPFCYRTSTRIYPCIRKKGQSSSKGTAISFAIDAPSRWNMRLNSGKKYLGELEVSSSRYCVHRFLVRFMFVVCLCSTSMPLFFFYYIN